MSEERHWLLLRGLGREVGHWPGFIARFQERFSNDRVHALDYPGVGSQKSISSATSVPQMSKHILSSVPASAKNLWIFGHSLGGMVALSAMIDDSTRVKGIVMVNTSTRDTVPAIQRLTPSSAWLLTQLLLDRNEKRREAGVLSLVSRDPERQADVLPIWQRLAKERPIPAVVVAKQLYAASRFKVPSGLPDSRPILCLSSLGDSLVDPRCSMALAKKLKADHEIHPWAGHELSLDDPDWALNKVQNWLKTHQPKS